MAYSPSIDSSDLGGTLASISPATKNALDASLPPIWSKANPVDIAGDADPKRYAAALEALLADRENDAVLVMNVQPRSRPADGCGKVGRYRRERASQPTAPAQTGIRRVGGRRWRSVNLSKRRHSALSSESDAVARLHASRTLQGSAR